MNPIRRSVAFTDWRTLSAAFMRSLYDIPMSDFSQKVIGELRKLGIEPMVHPSDISLLNEQRKSGQSVGRVFGPVTYRVIEKSNVVGCVPNQLTKGRNTVRVRFKAINKPFATLGDVLRFTPAHALVGDELKLGVDEKKNWYRVESYDGTNGVLRLVGKEKEETLTFNAIPLCEQFTIRHNNATNVTALSFGEIGREYQNMLQGSSSKDSPCMTGLIEIRHSDEDGASDSCKILLRGGIIQKKE